MKKIILPALLLSSLLLTACGGESSVSELSTAEETTSSAETTLNTTEEETTETAETTESLKTAETTDVSIDASADSAEKEDKSPAAIATSAAPAATKPAATAPPAVTNPPAQALNFWEEVQLNKDITPYLNARTDYTLTSSASCLGSGEDRIYTYPDVILTVYYENGVNTVNQIQITGSSIKTPEGVGVGDPISKAAEVYGGSMIDIHESSIGLIEFTYESNPDNLPVDTEPDPNEKIISYAVF